MSNEVALGLGIATCALAAVLLRYAGRPDTARRNLWSIAGWLALIPALVFLSLSLGAAVATATLLLIFSLFGYLALLLGMERRSPRTRTMRVAEPEIRPRVRWRGWVRGLTAFLLAAVSSVAIGSAGAGIPLGAPADRLSIGSMIVPLIWAAFIIWALVDRAILRPVIGMTGALAVSGAAIAWVLLA